MFGSKKADDNDGSPSSTWEKLLTSTPVVMTIVATLLAGMSTSEMTQAQYHRSLAAQNQSKVGDQWGLFQAKRIRGTSNEMAVKLMLASPGEITPELLLGCSGSLVDDMQRCVKKTETLIEKIDAAQSSLGADAKALKDRAEQLLKKAQDNAGKASEAKSKLDKRLGSEDVAKVFVFLTSDKLPDVGTNGEPTKSPGFSTIENVVKAIAAREEEQKILGAVALVEETNLQTAIDQAENRGPAFDKVCKPVDDMLRDVGDLVGKEIALARSIYPAVRKVTNMVEALPTSDSQPMKELRVAAEAIKTTSSGLRDDAQDLKQDFEATQCGYNARRYKREARDNQAIASLYDVKVYKSSWNSDRHIKRSRFFFFGMLAAQAGVTIASLALAVRMKSVLWSIAGLAGVIALLIGGYVYLYM